jgi:tripartite-type tricarboxylate transporter receptor subunit TctC
MNRRAFLTLTALCLAAPHVARAQAGGAIRMIVPFAPGGGSDVTARIVQPALSAGLGRSVVIENRTGAAGSVGTRLVAQATPDGSVIGISNTSPHGIVPLAMTPPPYDGDRDFTHIAMVAETPTVMLLPPNSRFGSFNELREAARTRSDGLTFGSSGIGGLQHLQGEVMTRLVGGRWVHVPYRGTGPGLQATLSGEVDCFLTPLAGTMAAIEQRQVRCIAVSTENPFDPLPGVPTYKELGLPELTVSSWTGISGPRGMPAALVTEMHAIVARTLTDPDTQRRLIAGGLYPPPRPVSQAEYQQIHADFARVWGPVVREARITVE